MKYKLIFITLVSSALAEESWITDSVADWKNNTESSTAITFKDGFAEPSAEVGTIKSKMKKFTNKTSVKSILIDQSPIWKNWTPTPNIGTKTMGNAPVLISIEDGNYWMFGSYLNKNNQKGAFKPKEAILDGFDIPLLTTPNDNEFNATGGLGKSLRGYHAWQSKDMKNWVHHGPITEGFSRWMTTAEYVDGKFYFYYDFPNDQDPHLYIDENLADGKPGKNMGLAFKDPSHGSDCTFFRESDGKFHVIYEDWSPINAKTHAWDSPLAGHAVSDDGISNFVILDPVIDLRTKPTGEIATFRHPHWTKEAPKIFKTDIAEYNVHTPEQEAFGDWASIKIGNQYYLFGDYDPVSEEGEKKKQMSTAWFTSDSLGKKFDFCGNIGKGHPDPDVCFAEGKFYLATQQNDDFVSDGPWVESVEVRVGVDTDNDSKIDQWTEWQKVTEKYDHTPGFVKHVKRTPASLDLSKLESGYSFQYEIKLTDTTENESKPILDKISLLFD